MHNRLIEMIVPRGRIDGDELARVGVCPDRSCLRRDIVCPQSGKEPPRVEHQSGVLVAVQSQRHLIEPLVALAPIFGCPACVKRCDRAVARIEPVGPSRPRPAVETLEADLIVDLPADDIGIVTVAARQLGGDAHRVTAIGWTCDGELAAFAMPLNTASVVDPADIGMRLGQPDGGRGGVYGWWR